MSYFKEFFLFLYDVLKSRNLIVDLARRDFRTKYLGSYLGMIWAFIHPAVSIVILWFVFQVGFKATPVDNIPFVLWLTAGMVPWFFLSEALSSSTNSITEHSYLVKKMVFRVSILPLVKILSALFVHLFFIVLVLAMFLLYGRWPRFSDLQVLYYLFSACVLLLGLSWVSSSLIIFLKDVGQIIAVLLQFGFWLTPILWSFRALPNRYLLFVYLNPAFYIVQGYRDSFIYGTWFWQTPLTIYYWALTLIILVFGAILFSRLRPHFADLL